jgi:hypothetical protein
MRGILGIHRPYLSNADLKALSANEAMEFSSTKIRTVVETYLREMSVPSKYADRMFSISGDQMYWINEADFEADFSGNIPELEDWLNAKCNERTDEEKRVDDMLHEKIKRGEGLTPEEQSHFSSTLRIKCEDDLRDNMREEAWKAYRG